MAKPDIHPHQYNRKDAADESSFEFDSEFGGGLLTLTARDDKLTVDVFRCDPTVDLRVPQENLVRRGPALEHGGTVLGAFEKVYRGALIRRSDEPDCYTRPVGSGNDAAVHRVRLHEGILELMIIDPGRWVNAAEYVIVAAPDV